MGNAFEFEPFFLISHLSTDSPHFHPVPWVQAVVNLHEAFFYTATQKNMNFKYSNVFIFSNTIITH